MRILIATPYLPWPLSHGGSVAQFSTLACLAEDHRFTLVCPIHTEAGMVHAKEFQAQLPQVNLRAVFCGNPPASEATLLGRAARVVLRCGRRILNPQTSHVEKSRPSKERPYYPFKALPETFVAALEDELSKGADLCQAEFAEMLPLGAWFPNELPKLFVHHQVHFVYARRFLDARGRDGFASYLEAVMQTQEQAYLQHFQGVITFSDEDRQALLSLVPPERLFTSPFPVPSDVGIAAEIPERFDGRFLFVASEDHFPNRDALEWLLGRIWPEIIRRSPSARLVVVGKWSEAAQAMMSAPGLTFSGYVRDLAATLRGGILLVPLRIGSGIRVKILAALAQGVPVVSTRVGCEGLQVRDEQELLVRDEPKDLAEAAVRLANDQELLKRLATNGRAAISTHYSSEAVRRRRNEIYGLLMQNHGQPD